MRARASGGVSLPVSRSKTLTWQPRIRVNSVTPSFNIAEKGTGSYRLLAILRWVMVVIFVTFGIQKFTPQSAHGIVLYISNSPFVSWLSVFGIRGEAYFLGIVELSIALLLVVGSFNPLLSAVGSLMAAGTFAVTWSFFFTTPGVVKWSFSTDPIAWNLTGEFLFKDIVLFSVCVVLFLASLPRSVICSRSSKVSDHDQHQQTDAMLISGYRSGRRTSASAID
jgi:uncharacterized membrane protein YkgB